MKTEFRKKLLVYPELQKGLVAYMMWLGLVVIIINIIGNLFFISETVTTLRTVGLTSESEISDVILLISLKASLITLGSVIVVVIAFGYFSLRFSNKIGGPALQMKNKLAAYINTGEPQVITLREKDYFKDLADLINRALEKKFGGEK